MTSFKSYLTLVSVFIIAGGLGASAHAAGAKQGHHGHHGAGHGKDDAAAIGAPGKASNVSRTITITLGDNYFEPESLAVKAGETVRLIVKNDGEFVHEFNIGTAAMHADHQRHMTMMVEHGVIEPDKINREMMKDDHGRGHSMAHDEPNSLLLEPGAKGELIWTFTGNGKLEFACNLPGHYDSGMVGTISLTQ